MRHAPVIVLLLALAGCAPQAERATTLHGMAVAGPTCPVVTQPPDPACLDRPVAGASVVILDAGGSEVATVVTGEDGRFSIALPAGTYQLVPQPVTGLMGTAAPVTVDIAGGVEPDTVTLGYDTGIR